MTNPAHGTQFTHFIHCDQYAGRTVSHPEQILDAGAQRSTLHTMTVLNVFCPQWWWLPDGRATHAA